MKGLVKGIPRHFNTNLSGVITNFSIDVGVKGRTIPFVFSPSSLSDTVTANFNSTTIPGASAPQITYTATGARQVSFSIDLPLDYLPPSSDFDNFEDYLNAFRALTYPRYSVAGDKVESPHCKLTTSNIEIDGVCTSCSIEYKTDRYANDGSMAASVSLAFMEVLDNVKYVDASFIANSKVNILGSTITSAGNSGSDEYNESITTVVSGDRCTVTIIGNKTTNLQSSNTSLLDAIKEGRYKDAGCNYTNSSKYSIKNIYGSVNSKYVGEIVSITNIVHTANNSWKCTVNGQEIYLKTSPPNGGFTTLGDTMQYFIIYVPYYDGNKYEIDSARWRFVNITKVVG